MYHYLIIPCLSILFLYLAYFYRSLYHPHNTLEIWRQGMSIEKVLWLISILLFVLWICLLCLGSKPKTLSLFYIGFIFFLIHMIGQWFFLKCDFQRPRKVISFSQYFVDNILGNLTIRPNQEYITLCDPINKKRISSIIVNRNLSILFLSLFFLSFYIKLPYFGKTMFK